MILVTFEDGFTAVAAIHEMVDGAGELDAQWARYSARDEIITDPVSRYLNANHPFPCLVGRATAYPHLVPSTRRS